ncbi:cytochrome c3 family protein [Geobacter sp. DSM 9736]|uniref:cytochrome c3 family protein n=1 Tax=Geobacter sp. DSM 9736 TaxID=1277350 RepID=UPI000B5FD7E8|nr:cytochrome c3 family protein [Geobacter sp. DSM 9736]SNB46643.1 doubled CXXCH domain-containing protein [Geobacter sp. DSM 9736]
MSASKKLLFRIPVVFLLLSLLPAWAGAAVTFIYPAEKSWVKRADYLIVKFNNPEITGAKITINGVESDLLNVGAPEYRKAFDDFLIVRPLWDKGKNAVVIDGYNAGKKVDSAATDIFFNPSFDLKAVPGEYRPNILHTAANEKLCASCHNMKPTSAQLNSAPGKEHPCFTCHKSMMDVKFVHGPAGTYSCTYCHTIEGDPKFAVTRRDAALCMECHSDKTEEFKKRKYLHGPIDAGLCEVCHDPHGSAYPSQLRMAAKDLCLSCHAKIATELHAVRTPRGTGHPLSAKEDTSPLRKGKEFSCVSCHKPHAGDVRYYYQSNLEEKMGLCRLCHNY